MSDINMATPRAILRGFQDVPLSQATIETEQLPQHMPIIYLLTERGPVNDPQLCIGNGFNNLFGASSLKLNSAYATHATILATTIMKNANQCMIQRVVPAGAATATIRLSAEVIPAAIVQYQRNSDGTFAVDSSGAFIPITYTTGVSPYQVTNILTVPGHRIVWHADLTGYTGAARNYGQGNIVADFRSGTTTAGGQALSTLTSANFTGVLAAEFTTMPSLSGTVPLAYPVLIGGNAKPGDQILISDPNNTEFNGYYTYSENGSNYTLTPLTAPYTVTSTLIPLVDLPVAFPGDYGNRVGLQLAAPNAISPAPGNTSLMTAIGAFLYRFACVERPVTTTSPVTTATQDGAQYIDACFKENVYDPTSDLPLSALDTFLQAYQNFDDPTVPPTYAPFGEMFLYRENLGNLLDLLVTGGTSSDTTDIFATVEGNILLTDAKANAPAPDGHIVDLVGQTVASQNGYYTVSITGADYTLIPWNPGQPDQVDTVGENAFDLQAEAYGRSSAQQFGTDPSKFHLLNILTGIDLNGVPYYTLDVANSVKFGGVAFGNGNTIYATGGSDGLPLDINGKPDMVTTMAIFDDLVNTELAGFGSLQAQVLNMAMYPISTVWDSGFTHATKDNLFVPMSVRPDIWVAASSQSLGEYNGPVYSGSGTTVLDGNGNPIANQITISGIGTVTDQTHITIAPRNALAIPAGNYLVSVGEGGYTLQQFVLQPANTAEQDNSYALGLMARASLFPESPYYGTPTCRAIVVGRCGTLLNSTYKKIMPLTIDVADKVSKYMGAGDGIWNTSAVIDNFPNNVITMFRDINVVWENDTAYNNDWAAGMIYPIQYDRASAQYPALQTVYPLDSSVLNSFSNMAGATYLWKILAISWKQLTGRDDLTPDQFCAKSNQLILSMVKGIFGGRFQVKVNTFLTGGDKQRGYSYSCQLTFGANLMMTVGSFTITTEQIAQLTGQTSTSTTSANSATTANSVVTA